MFEVCVRNKTLTCVPVSGPLDDVYDLTLPLGTNTAYLKSNNPHYYYINYFVISSAVQQVDEGHTVFGVGQAVQCDIIIPTALGCNTYHCAQRMKSDL